MIKLSGIELGYRDKIVFSGFNLQLPESGVVSLSGPSGSGKTTLLRLLAGLVKMSKGEITGLAHKRVSMVFQEDRLLPWFTVLENVRIALPDVIGDKGNLAEKWLDRMELKQDMQKYPHALSGGMQRRVALARACACGGDILLLDEPFAGLDDALRKRIAPYIIEAAPLIVLVTHEKEDANSLNAVMNVSLA